MRECCPILRALAGARKSRLGRMHGRNHELAHEGLPGHLKVVRNVDYRPASLQKSPIDQGHPQSVFTADTKGKDRIQP